MIIKHKLCLSDEETIEQIRENPYLQYFVGFQAFHKEQAFAPSLFVEIRRRMGPVVFARFEDSIIARLSDHQKPETAPDDNQTTTPGGGEAIPGDDAKPTPPDQQPTTHRGKQNKAVEFGAKLGVSLSGDGVACVDHLSWDAYHEGHDLPGQVEAYRHRHGHYPEKVLADPLYGTRDNRKFLRE